MYRICYLETFKWMGIPHGSAPLGSSPTDPGSGFSVMPHQLWCSEALQYDMANKELIN